MPIPDTEGRTSCEAAWVHEEVTKTDKKQIPDICDGMIHQYIWYFLLIGMHEKVRWTFSKCMI